MTTFSKKEQKLIDRFRASGHVGINVQRDAPFKFLVRPFTTVGVDSLDLASWFENDIFSSIKSLIFESPITGIVIFPTIFDEGVGAAPEDYVKYNRNERSVFVGVKIEFATWSSASRQEKLRLLSDNIERSIERIPDIYLLGRDRERLINTTNQVHRHLVARLKQ
jgi:hypothetical protein